MTIERFTISYDHMKSVVESALREEKRTQKL